MNCEHARLLIGAAPDSASPELAEHLQSCPACSAYQSEMVALEANIRRALEQAPFAGLGAEGAVRPAATPTSESTVQAGTVRPIEAARATTAAGRRAGATAWRGWALAASVLIVAVTTLAVWSLRPTDTLAHDLAEHVIDEPNSWESRQPVDAHSLEDILRKAGVDSGITSREVIYARTCLFRGHFVPHLVVQTTTGPVTVLVLPDEHVKKRESFFDSGLAGVIVPAQHGSIAVLARASADLDGVAHEMRLGISAPSGGQ